MSGAKETPRQKMIGMMYLVLTAMLALNVSKEIIHAFVSVNESMVATNKNFDAKLEDTYTKFQNIAATDAAAKQWYTKALEARNYSDSLVNYLIDIRSDVILKTEGKKNEYYYNEETGKVNMDSLRNVPLTEIKVLDDYSTPTNFFLGEGDLLPGEAKTMKEKFALYRGDMIQLVKPRDSSQLKIGLRTDGKYKNPESGETLDWENHMFSHTILAADVVILNKYVAEIRNVEFDVLTKLMSYVGAETFKFNKVEAKVIPEKSYVFKGSEYKAQILVAAFDTVENPDVRYKMNIDSLTAAMMANSIDVPGENGVVNINIPTNGLGIGVQKFAGVIRIRDPKDREKFIPYHFHTEFNVGEPTAIISADGLNVFYKDINNPMSISIPGVPPTDVSYNITKGKAKIKQKAPGVYDVMPTGKENEDIEISALATIDGKSQVIGKKLFRVKNTPPPTPIVAGYKGGEVLAKNTLLNAKQPFLEAKLLDFLFESKELNFTVTSYEVSVSAGGATTTRKYQGNSLNEELKGTIRRLNNTNITFQKIEVDGPGGLRTLTGAVVFTIN